MLDSQQNAKRDEAPNYILTVIAVLCFGGGVLMNAHSLFVAENGWTYYGGLGLLVVGIMSWVLRHGVEVRMPLTPRFSIRHLLLFVLFVSVGMGIYPIVTSGGADIPDIPSMTVLRVFGAIVGLASFGLAWILVLRRP